MAQKQLMGSGGHRPIASFDLNQKDFQISMNKLQKLYPKSDTRVKRALQSAMRVSMRPAKSDLKKRIPASGRVGHSGRLKKSIKIFNGKPKKNQWPMVFLGPLVKVPKKIKAKKGESKKSSNARYQKWVRESSGYYLYFLEYGFTPGIDGSYVGGKNYLKKTMDSSGNAVMNRLGNDIINTIDKRFKKRFG